MTEKTKSPPKKQQVTQKSQTTDKKTSMKESAIYVSKSMYERFQQDWVLRGPVVAIVKWSVVSLVILYILAVSVDYIFKLETKLQDFITKQLSIIWFYLEIFLFSYIVYHDFEKAFLPPNPSLFEKYRSLLFWFSFINLSIIIYNLIFRN
jgi:hypothetical protein